MALTFTPDPLGRVPVGGGLKAMVGAWACTGPHQAATLKIECAAVYGYQFISNDTPTATQTGGAEQEPRVKYSYSGGYATLTVTSPVQVTSGTYHVLVK